MNHVSRQAIAFATGAVAVVGLGFGGVALAQRGTEPAQPQQSQTQTNDEPTEADAQAAVAGVTYLNECVEGNVVQEPATYTLACGDSNASLDSLAWSDWGAEEATATGELVINDCDPSCAEGQLLRFPVEVTADQLVLGEAAAAYGNISVHFTGDVPDGFEQDEQFAQPGIEAANPDTVGEDQGPDEGASQSE